MAVILARVVLGVVLRFVQEMHADKATEKLEAMVSNTATLVRGGKEEEVSLKMPVPGLRFRPWQTRLGLSRCAVAVLALPGHHAAVLCHSDTRREDLVCAQIWRMKVVSTRSQRNKNIHLILFLLFLAAVRGNSI